MKWINIQDDLPCEDTEVLVCVGDDVVISTSRKNSDDDLYFDCEISMNIDDGIVFNGDLVTHWMPLPKSPTEE